MDLGREIVEVLRDPHAQGYRTARAYRRGERIAAAALPGLEVAVDEIMGG